MKKIIFTLIISLVVVGGLVFANREIKNETPKISPPKKLTAAEMKAARKQWEASSDGIMYKKWEESPVGKKVYAAEAKIRKSISNFTNMEAIVTSLSLPPNSRLGFGIMTRINDEDFILSFGPLKLNELQQLHSLKVNDKILLKSHSVMHAPKYTYPIVAGDYIERNSKIIYNRPPRKGGC
jgi:hypothetical protein|nr:hypothetical protein [uncultured Emticicia sp.]